MLNTRKIQFQKANFTIFYSPLKKQLALQNLIWFPRSCSMTTESNKPRQPSRNGLSNKHRKTMPKHQERTTVAANPDCKKLYSAAVPVIALVYSSLRELAIERTACMWHPLVAHMSSEFAMEMLGNKIIYYVVVGEYHAMEVLQQYYAINPLEVAENIQEGSGRSISIPGFQICATLIATK